MPTRRDNADRPLAPGKIPPELLARLLGQFPASPPDVLLGARTGEDACAIDVGGGVVVVAADPITLTSAEAGRLAVVVNANDVAVTGARPRWFLAVVLVPPGSTEGLVDGIFSSILSALDDLGAHLVGGHTEVTSAVSRPVVVGQMLGIAERGVVTTAGFEPGDLVLQVKPAPIEGAAVLAREALGLDELDSTLLDGAKAALEQPGVSIVDPALLAAALGATALHDPTEGGLAGGLHEMASAAGHRIVVDRGSVLWFQPGLAICEALGADPWNTLASGTLLAAFPSSEVPNVLSALDESGYTSAVIGRVEHGSGVEDETGSPIPWPDRDEVARLLSARRADDSADTI